MDGKGELIVVIEIISVDKSIVLGLFLNDPSTIFDVILLVARLFLDFQLPKGLAMFIMLHLLYCYHDNDQHLLHVVEKFCYLMNLDYLLLLVMRIMLNH
jgi:hypothetical protein